MKPFIYKRKGKLLLSIFFGIVANSLGVVLAYAMGNLTNAAIEGTWSPLRLNALLTVTAIVGMFVFNSLDTYFNRLFSKKVLLDVKAAIFAKLLKGRRMTVEALPEAFVLNLFQSDADTLYKSYLTALSTIVGYGFKIVISLVALYFIDAQLFGAFVAVSTVPPLLVRALKKRSSHAYERFSESAASSLEAVKEFVTGRNTIVDNGAGEGFKAKMGAVDASYEQRRLVREVVDRVVVELSSSIGMIAHMGCMIIAAVLIVRGDITVGAMIAGTQLLNFVFSPLNALLSRMTHLKATKGVRAHYEQVLAIEESGSERQFENGAIEYKGVSIDYEGKEVVQPFSYTFEAGKKYAFIGRSGSGKTSLLSALMGKVAYRGAIEINGVDVQTLDYDDLLRHVDYVAQNPFVFNDTIANNVRLNRPLAVEPAALARVNLTPAFFSRPEAVGTGGVKLSGGERQRLALLRSAIRPSSIVIFDEPTSALDPENVAWVHRFIFDCADKTVFVITHDRRAAYLSKFDGIIDLDRLQGGV